MPGEPIDLERFRLQGLIGEGADCQVFAATDEETGRPVVVKRPHPALISRLQHAAVEERLARTIELRTSPAPSLPHVVGLVGAAPRARHDSYFGDALGQEYTVAVEECARGVPLIGSTVDGIKGAPIGLPQRLFALHPLVPHSGRGTWTILRDLLDTAKAFQDAGIVLNDVQPQNVYFDPRRAKITIVDIGNVALTGATTSRHPSPDLHDLYLELFKWYVTAEGPPDAATGYARPHNRLGGATFSNSLRSLLDELSAVDRDPLKAKATEILDRIGSRGYPSVDEFRGDFDEYLELAHDRQAHLPELADLTGVWHEALAKLRDPYWRKFLFDPDTDLEPYAA